MDELQWHFIDGNKSSAYVHVLPGVYLMAAIKRPDSSPAFWRIQINPYINWVTTDIEGEPSLEEAKSVAITGLRAKLGELDSMLAELGQRTGREHGRTNDR